MRAGVKALGKQLAEMGEGDRAQVATYESVYREVKSKPRGRRRAAKKVAPRTAKRHKPAVTQTVGGIPAAGDIAPGQIG